MNDVETKGGKQVLSLINRETEEFIEKISMTKSTT